MIVSIHMGKLKPSPLEDQSVLLSSELSLQPLKNLLFKKKKKPQLIIKIIFTFTHNLTLFNVGLFLLETYWNSLC